MGTLIAGLDILTIQEPIFKDVKYYLSGDVPEKITELLSAGGAERTKYFSDFVTHVICGANAPETDLTDANDLYEIPAVTAQWVITCARLRKLVSPKAYSPNKVQIFSNTITCISKVSVKDAKHLYALITYHGGQVKLNLDSTCTHLVCGLASGKKYTVALNIPVERLKIVTPDWVLDSIKAKIQCVAEVYHPKLLIIPVPKPILPVQNTKRTESRISAITGFDFEEGIAKNEVPTHNLSDKDIESTQALLDKLKQRMPWNHPPSSGSLVSTSCPPSTTPAAGIKTSLTQQMVTQTIQKNIITNINASTAQYSQPSQMTQSQTAQSPNVSVQQQVQQQQPHGLSAIQLQQQRLLQQHQLRVQMLQQQNQNKNITQQVQHQQNFISQQQQQTPNISMVSQLNQNISMNQQNQIQMQHASQSSHIIQQQNQSLTQSQQAQQQIQNISQMLSQSTPLSQSPQLNQHGQNMKQGLLINQHSQSVSLSSQIQNNITNQTVQSITQQIIQTSQAMAQQAAQNQNLNQQQMSQLNQQQLLNNTLQSLTSQQSQNNLTQQQQTQQMGMSPQNQNMGLVSQQSVTPQTSQVQSIQLNQLMNAGQQNQLHQLQNQQNLPVQGQQGVNVSLQPNWRQQNIQMVQNASPAQHQLIRSPMMQQRGQQSQMILQQQLQLQNQQQVMLNNQQQLQQSPQNPMQQQSPQQILQQSINNQQTQGITHSQSHHQILVQKQQMVGPGGQQQVLINQHGGQAHQQILVPGSQHVNLQGTQQLVSQSQIIQQGGKQIITQAGQQIITQGNQQVLPGNQHVITQGSQHQVMISQPTQQITQTGQQIVNQNQQGPNQQGQQVIQQQVGQQHQVLGQQNSGVQQIITHQGGQQIVAQGGQQIVQGGQQIVQGGPQIVQGGPQIVQGGQQIVQGGQQLVQGSQQIVQGGQQLVAGQQIVGTNQQIVGSGQQLVQGSQQIIQGGQPIVQGQQQPGQNIMWQQQQQYIQRQQQIIAGQPGTVGQRVSWAAGAGGRQLIHLDAQTHAQLQQMDPQQRALFVAQLQKRRQLSMQRAAAIAHQQQQQQQQQQQHQPGVAGTPTASTGGTAQSVTFIRGQMPPGLTQQQQVQWLQQQGARASVVAASPTPPSPAPGTPGVGSLDAQYQQLQLQRQQQYQRLQQLQAQREHVAAHHKPHQQTVQGLNNRPPNAIALPDGTAEASVVTPVIATEQPGVVGGAAAGSALVVNPKTKTALANMLSIRLQGAGTGPAPPGAAPEVAEPSAAGTLRLMTAAHNAPPRTPAPRLLVGGAPPALVLPHSPQHPAPQHQVGTKMTFPVGATPAVGAATPARPPPPPRAQFYGHNPNLKLPPDLFLLGCVFHIVEYQQSWGAERVARWAEAVGRRGGEVEAAYCARVTHVLCETQRHGVVMQALRDGKRCVTAYWLSDAMVRRAVSPPWQALHLPALYAARDRPARAHRASLSGWRADERHRVRFMIEHVGAKLTSYLTRDNTVLVCKRAEGAKYRRAREWGLPCVSTLWLTDLLLGNMSALSQIENAKYQQFNLASPFRMEYTLVPHLMNPWKMPINITQESHERVKRGALAAPRRAKRPRLEPPPVEPDAPAVPPPPEHLAPRVLFSNVAELARLSAIVKQLGGRIVTVARDATHLVMDKLVRTPKLITCLVTVKHLLSPDWLHEGRKLNKFADEAKFALRDDSFNQMFKCDVSEVLLSGEQRKKLFEGITFYLTPCVQPSRVILTEMIELCGGKVDKNRKSFVSIQEMHKEKPYSYLVVTTPNDLHLVYYLLQSEKSINVVCNTELILSAILRQKLDVEEFLVKFD